MANKNAKKGAVIKTTAPKIEKLDKDIVIVKFLKSHTPYIKDEIAGFDKKFAQKLIDGDVASEFKK